MTTRPTSVRLSTTTRTWRSVVFMVAALAIGLLLISGELGNVLQPWLPHQHVHDPTVAVPIMHKWHYAQRSMHSLVLLALPVLVVAWRPRQYLVVMQFLLLSVGLMIALLLPFRPADALILGTGLGGLVALYPEVRRLLERPLLKGLNRPLLALTVLCSPWMLAEMVRLVQWQALGVGGEHASVGHWIGAASIPPALLLAGLGAATSMRGARALGIIAALGYGYLGAAALALYGYDGSWGSYGGAAALLVGAVYLGLTAREAQRTNQPVVPDQR